MRSTFILATLSAFILFQSSEWKADRNPDFVLEEWDAELEDPVPAGCGLKFKVSSKTGFIHGDNEYRLYFGEMYFNIYQETKVNGTYYLEFTISSEDYSKIKLGSPVVIAYGELTEEEIKLGEQLPTSRTSKYLATYGYVAPEE